VRPIGSNEHDVDLIAKFSYHDGRDPASIKRAIGDRLKEHMTYAGILCEKTRCWRLDYANEFHLDITPSIPNPACMNGGELVPDRSLRCWKASNPRAYRDLFEARAILQPMLRLAKVDFAEERARADVEPYPEVTGFKGLLRRIVQLSKRHRDVYFSTRDATLAPISIVLTTLAMQSYEYCVKSFAYDSELDVLLDVVRRMPDFIERSYRSSVIEWAVWNETTSDENFAERWNEDPRLPKAFFDWHASITSDIDTLPGTEGMDALTKSLGKAFGGGPAERAVAMEIKSVSEARNQGRLLVAPKVGLTTLAATAGATRVRANTFFGAP
jgi:hypothetical protein